MGPDRRDTPRVYSGRWVVIYLYRADEDLEVLIAGREGAAKVKPIIPQLILGKQPPEEARFRV